MRFSRKIAKGSSKADLKQLLHLEVMKKGW